MTLPLVALLAAHLLAVDVASAGPLVALWCEWREARGCAAAGRAGRFLVGAACVGLVAGGLLGLAAGWIVWDDDFRSLLGRLSSKIHFGGWELLFSLVLLSVQLAWWRGDPQATRFRRLWRGLVGLLAGTNLLYHFPVLFVVISTLARRGEVAGPAITSSQFRQLLVESEVLARTTHFALAAFAVTGTLWMLYGLRLHAAARSGDPSHLDQAAHDDSGRRIVLWGARLALIPTFLQMLVGLWVVTAVDPAAQQRLLGGDLVAAGLLAASVLLSLWMMHVLAAIALGEVQPSKVRRGVLLMVLVVALMTGTSHRALRQPRQAAQRTAAASPALVGSEPAPTSRDADRSAR